jgi:hypothetical protein
MRNANTLAGALGLSLLVIESVAAQAPGPEHVRATIVRVDGDDVYVDAGDQALSGTDTLTVYRRITVRHPLTKKPLQDRFVIGELQLVQRGQALSLARAKATPSHPFAVGDAAENAPARSAELATTAQPIAANAAIEGAKEATSGATSAVTVRSDDARELLRYFQATAGMPPAGRVRWYRAYLARFPRSPYRSFVEQELRYLGTWDSALKVRAVSLEQARARALLASAVELQPPWQVAQGEPLSLSALVRRDARVRGLVVHVRPQGQELYRQVPMTFDGRGHASAELPPALVRAPGLELFIEAVDQDGKSAAAFASAREPRAVRVVTGHEHEEPAPAGPSMRVRFSSEYASFHNTSGRDYFLIHEGDFLYRVRLGRLYGVRLGYGRFDGEGGTVEQLDEQGLAPRPAGFTYAYFESELALSELVGLALRGTLGLGRPDPGENGELAGGFQTRLRIGEAEGTHLVVAGELLPEIGQRALLHLGFELIERVPMAAEVQVTDQPVNSDELAVRIVYELGVRVTDRIAVALRPSYQLRTIRHAGPGLGLSATFDW